MHRCVVCLVRLRNTLITSSGYKMKSLFASVLLAAIAVSALPNPQDIVCTAVCREVKPICPAGQEASGSEGCWGCCQPIKPPTMCTDVCRVIKPVCPVGQAPTGSKGCWGCCRPIRTITKISPIPKPTPRPCLTVCLIEKPVCPLGEAATGSEGCWGCCQPIGTF